MVRMAPKLTFGTGPADWQERLNVDRLKEERVARARQVMREHGIAAILTTDNSNLRYLTGLRLPPGMSINGNVIFLAERDPIFLDFPQPATGIQELANHILANQPILNSCKWQLWPTDGWHRCGNPASSGKRRGCAGSPIFRVWLV